MYTQRAKAISNYSNKSNLKAPVKCFFYQRSMSEEFEGITVWRTSVANETAISTTVLLDSILLFLMTWAQRERQQIGQNSVVFSIMNNIWCVCGADSNFLWRFKFFLPSPSSSFFSCEKHCRHNNLNILRVVESDKNLTKQVTWCYIRKSSSLD